MSSQTRTHKLTHVHARTHAPNKQGTLTYMAPEQSGRVLMPIDYRADFYSLGITFYHVLAGLFSIIILYLFSFDIGFVFMLCRSGRLPFEIHSTQQVIDWHITKQPTPLIDLPETRIPVCQVSINDDFIIVVVVVASKYTYNIDMVGAIRHCRPINAERSKRSLSERARLGCRSSTMFT
jgi:serine/threonine protein kinase